uniref:Uncharacterized protein n=2 Tax=Picea TaxID=3328 RepID=A0A101LXS6_PICGL|nr:hypothetical protein ABT39_MTgene5465 [Picea glauca]QHR91527.1 hypothetical protein Q903MT_gene5562 [Picea sitchensis]
MVSRFLPTAVVSIKKEALASSLNVTVVLATPCCGIGHPLICSVPWIASTPVSVFRDGSWMDSYPNLYISGPKLRLPSGPRGTGQVKCVAGS